MTRSNAREIAVHLVYGLYFTEDATEEVVSTRMAEDYYKGLADVTEVYSDRPNGKQMDYIRTLVAGVRDKKEELDGYIAKYAINWRLDRISKITRSIMEVAIYEILYVADVPAGAAINEAVELCKRYDDDDAASFVNGILGSFAKEVSSDVSGT